MITAPRTPHHSHPILLSVTFSSYPKGRPRSNREAGAPRFAGKEGAEGRTPCLRVCAASSPASPGPPRSHPGPQGCHAACGVRRACVSPGGKERRPGWPASLQRFTREGTAFLPESQWVPKRKAQQKEGRSSLPCSHPPGPQQGSPTPFPLDPPPQTGVCPH